MAEQLLDTTTGRVVVKTKRGRLTIGPQNHIDGLWQIVQREMRTNDQVRELAGGVTRHTLLAWRKRARNPFPPPRVLLPYGKSTLELWSRTEVEEWLQARETAR